MISGPWDRVHALRRAGRVKSPNDPDDTTSADPGPDDAAPPAPPSIGNSMAGVVATQSAATIPAFTVVSQAQVQTQASQPVTTRHYAANGNFATGVYGPAADGFNLADVSSLSTLNALPSGVKGLVYLGNLNNGADSTFINTVTPFIGNPHLYGFYLADEPDPAVYTSANLKAESDWIHANAPGAITFIVLQNFGSPTKPSYVNTFNPANTGIDLYGLDPYPIRPVFSGGINLGVIPAAVAAAETAGIPLDQIVPVYQAFGQNPAVNWTLPTAAQETSILSSWGSAVPNPAFDYAYSWGVQSGDLTLSQSPDLQAVFAAHNARTLSWTGAGGTSFANVASWSDTTNALSTALTAPVAVDAAQFLTGGGTITGTGTAAALQFGGPVQWNVASSAKLSAMSGVTVGQDGTGSLLINGGASISGLGAADTISGAAGQSASVTVVGTGSAWKSAGELIVGSGGGGGTLTIQNAGSVLTGGAIGAPSPGIDIGQSADGSGGITVTGAKSLLSNTGQFIVGDGALGSLAINAGGAVTTTPGTVVGLAGAVIANSGSASGSSVNVSGAGSNWQVNGALVAGQGGLGSLSITQGGTVGAASLDEGATATGNGVVSVADAGSALNIAGLLTVGDQSSGGLSVLGGGLVTALNANLGLTATGSGNIDIEGAGSTLRIGMKTNGVVSGGDLNVGVAGGGVITVGAGATLTAMHALLISGLSTLNNLGGTVDPDTIVNTSANGSSALGLTQAGVYIANESTYVTNSGTGTIDTPLVQTGTDAVDAQANIDSGILGIWQIGSLGVLVMNINTVDAGQVVLFGNKTAELVIGQQVTGGTGVDPVVQPGAASVLPNFHAQIWGYVAGNQILFRNLTVASDSVGGNTVTLFDAGHNTLGSLSFFNKFGAASTTAATAAAAQIVPCYVAGTRIETVAGLRAVETLRADDEVRTVLGGPARIVWVGSRTVDCARHPRPETVWPVRIERHAFGPDLPARELLVSPDHAIYVDDVLIPAKLLANGTSIRQVKRRRVAYHHIELARHDVVLAEGLPAETYLDTGDRAKFSGEAVTALYQDFTARAWEMAGCAPIVLTGERLEQARARLVARSVMPERDIRPAAIRHT